MEEIKIFKMNDYDWVAASNLEGAKLCLAKECADGIVDADFEDEFLDNPRALTDDEMLECQFYDDEPKWDEDKQDYIISTSRSFREELTKRIDRGESFPQYFALGEW